MGQTDKTVVGWCGVAAACSAQDQDQGSNPTHLAVKTFSGLCRKAAGRVAFKEPRPIQADNFLSRSERYNYLYDLPQSTKAFARTITKTRSVFSFAPSSPPTVRSENDNTSTDSLWLARVRRAFVPAAGSTGAGEVWSKPGGAARSWSSFAPHCFRSTRWKS
ncbi:hypothetical protein Bbelb_093010 [Branchiostoma belcheri]|nr:hypothetical protein Bbelb_093010 [Branchiostoma belcheri]